MRLPKTCTIIEMGSAPFALMARRCRQFPSLISCTTINWFSAWPDDALLSVARRFLAGVELGGSGTTAAGGSGGGLLVDAVAGACVGIHTSVMAVAERFAVELRRR
jgi:dynein heavy chain, axonemal